MIICLIFSVPSRGVNHTPVCGYSKWESPGVEADGRGAVGKGAQTEGAAEVRKEGAGGGDAPEAEGEERHVGPGERDINAYKVPRKITIIPL